MRGAALTLAVVVAGAAPALAQSCPHPPELGRVVLPGAPCFEISAVYDRPTTRYPHGALGDAEEWASMVVRKDNVKVFVNVPVTYVFEDLAPRLANFDADPDPEFVTVESYASGGAALVVYDPDFDGAGQPTVKRMAATRVIGQRNRWLAPVGIADFDADGRMDVAYVETPHLGMVLKFVTPTPDGMEALAEAEGYTNHRFGEAFIQGGVRDCGAGPEALTASADWTRILAARLEGGQVVASDLGPYDGPESFTPHLDCAG
ncbi:VCBS repeat-containing protein [Rhodobacteraceae bacterium 2CG4]|uniref:VCBS repeat-containing protein n=1 Tax=Halovulum marinum TaxID=2662447 RepID=A0A6L5Z258_9RHOB|nr:VCBS repeat-containing protein [Halovulum marinum]MSU90122.1 VCBS repeat-containing protein [Halovulum marinum]